jgi:hypothetical protein
VVETKDFFMVVYLLPYAVLRTCDAYWAIIPPSITSSAPVTKLDSSEAR